MKNTSAFKVSGILCPVDFSELSNLALKYAAAGAKAYNAKLIVLHAERFEMPAYFTAAQVDELARQLADARGEARSYLEQRTHAILGPLADEIPITFQVVDTHPVDAVLTVATKHGTDLIVLGTHGREGAKRLWLGSVTENVVRHAEVPVFVVRQKQYEFIDASAAPELKTILCPVNFTSVARTALQVASSIAEQFHARLIPICVVEPGDSRSLSDAEAELRSWLDESLTAPCVFDPVSRQGHAAEQIVALARKLKADLVVLGAQRRGSAMDSLFGSTTEQVLRQAPVPVLVVPNPAKD